MSVEQTYKKYTQIEHVLARPGMYIGETNTTISDQWILDSENDLFINSPNIRWNPGIYKLFDEIITNSSDECQRNKNVKTIKVDIINNTISIFNDGSGIPIEIHKEHNIYIPELIFCNLLSSSNYNDSIKRTTGGLNGLGAKLTNIYSLEFTIETVYKGQKYIQTCKNNLSEIGQPQITKVPIKTKEYTKITFTPDLKRFKLNNLSDFNTIDILKKRTIDISAITNKSVSVYFNNEKIKCKDFSEYINYYIGNKSESPRVIYEDPNERWQIGIALSKKDSFQQVSFVNGISTIDGGSHIDHIILPIIKKCTEEIQSKHKNITIKQQYVKDSLFLFVNCLIDNPTFSSQTKDKHTTRVSEFGSKVNIPDEIIKKILKLGFVDSLLAIAEAKEKKTLSKTDGKKVSRLNIPKLDDANKAGTNESNKCTLILTEGDSAKTTAISGLTIVGRDYYGVFPLRGKLLNTREASFSQISKNEEILNIKKILGLQTGNESINSLRYSKILIMTDADYDGFHIKGLIINFIDSGWSGLLKNLFVGSILTPVVKINFKNEKLSFYTLKEYQDFIKSDNSNKKWNTKYYKGLGTSTAAEAREYFKDLKVLNYQVKTSEDSLAIQLAFKKSEADARKKWIIDNSEDFHNFQGLDYSTKEIIPIKQLIDKELVLFSISDNVRSIPNLIDGLKPSQRKVLFGCFKKGLTKNSEIKVAQLSGYISEQSNYHHGEVSLQETIINMAQNYIGSNNMNLLEPIGQFGTRLMNGKDSSSPRYIFTTLSDNTRKLFNTSDFNIIEYQEEENMKIEPKYYVPILPLILINGAEGIGTGFSTKIPSFNPEELKYYLEKLIDDPEYEIPELTPWYSGFQGNIEKIETNKWITYGVYSITENIITITELPIGESIENYKTYLEKLEKEDTIITFKNNSSDTIINFEIRLSSKKLDELEKNESLEKTFKLTSNLCATNMHVFNQNGKIIKMTCPEEILYEFYKIRIEYNKKRKQYLLNQLDINIKIINSKVKFIQGIIDENIIVFRKKKEFIIEQIEKLNLYKYNNNYNYLTEMPISTFSEEKIIQLEKELEKNQKEYISLQSKNEKDLFKEDLQNI